MSKPTVSVIGLGKLGSPMVAAFASRGYKVIGVDINLDFVRLINEGNSPVSETDLVEYLKNNRERISATHDYEKAVLNSDITFIIVPTPSKESGEFSTEYVIEAGKRIGETLKNKSKYHLVVLTSTVIPGDTEKKLLSVLEEKSEKKCGESFGLCYNPEFIALGDVINGILYPDFVLIGENNKKAGEILERFYNDVCEKKPPIKRMSIVNAEITKIALNTYVTTKISYANMLAELCEKISGGNIDIVTDALGCDNRVGKKYLKGALGYGGPCFPRDNRALTFTANKFDVSLLIAEATDKINKYQILRLVNKIISIIPKAGNVTILGLSYKTKTDVIEESQAVEIAKNLSEKGIKVVVYDPVAMDNAKKVLKKIIFASSLEGAVRNADVIIIATPWEEFKNINSNWLKQGVIFFDCWRILNSEKYKEKAKYLALGINS